MTIYWLQSSCEFILILLCKEIDLQNRSPEVPEGMPRDSKWSSGSRDTPDFGSSVVKKQSPGIKILALLSDWSIRDSNPWPPQCECGALPAALIPHNGNNGARTHDLPLVRRALSQLSYVSILFFGSSVFLSSLQHGMPDAASGPGGNQPEELPNDS